MTDRRGFIGWAQHSVGGWRLGIQCKWDLQPGDLFSRQPTNTPLPCERHDTGSLVCLSNRRGVGVCHAEIHRFGSSLPSVPYPTRPLAMFGNRITRCGSLCVGTDGSPDVVRKVGLGFIWRRHVVYFIACYSSFVLKKVAWMKSFKKSLWFPSHPIPKKIRTRGTEFCCLS